MLIFLLKYKIWWETLKTKSHPNPKNLSTKVKKKANNLLFELAFNQNECAEMTAKTEKYLTVLQNLAGTTCLSPLGSYNKALQTM